MALSDRPWWSFLPIGSFYYFCSESNNDYDSDFAAVIAGFAHLALIVVLFATPSYFNNRAVKIKNQKIEKEYTEKYAELEKKVFGRGGYADTNFNNVIELSERASAYRKIGFDQPFYEGETFSALSLEQLEKLVRYYEEKN